jgi:hypothetical protein
MVKCKKCGNKMERTNKFCSECGAKNYRGLGCVLVFLIIPILIIIGAISTTQNEIDSLSEAVPSVLERSEVAKVLLETGSIEQFVNGNSGVVVEWPITISKLNRSETEFYEDNSDYEIRVKLEFRDSNERKLFKDSHKGDTVMIKGILTHSYMEGGIKKKPALVINPAFILDESATTQTTTHESK